MANKTEYNISDLLNLAFGTNGKLIEFKDIPMDEPADPEIVFTIEGPFELTADNVVSKLGTPVVFPITFLGGVYNTYQDGRIVDVELEDYMLPFTAIADFKRSKIKQKTRISGGNGSVKELFGFDDWQINIQGFIIGDGEYPEQDIMKLLAYEQLADSIKVQGKVFELLNIYEIDINEIDIKQMKGYPNVVPFSISCESNEPTELILKYG
jgi:hypothetical protein